MVRKLYDLAVGIPPLVRIGPLATFGLVGLAQGMTLAPAGYLAACIVILINMRKR